MVAFPFSSAGFSAVTEVPALIAVRSRASAASSLVVAASTARSMRLSPSATAAWRSVARSLAIRVRVRLYGWRNSGSPVAA